MIITSTIVGPWSEFIFNLKAIEKLFIVKTRENRLFRNTHKASNLKGLNDKRDKLKDEKERKLLKIGKLSFS